MANAPDRRRRSRPVALRIGGQAATPNGGRSASVQAAKGAAARKGLVLAGGQPGRSRSPMGGAGIYP
ncbi:MAG: hypothetical protein ACOY5C_14600 [Pseudomonadota bacterium]